MKQPRYSRLRKIYEMFITARQDQISDIEDKYIEENKEYKEGEIVKVYLHGNYKGDGIITGNELDKDKQTINPIIHKLNTKGEPRKARFWNWFNYDKIERK